MAESQIPLKKYEKMAEVLRQQIADGRFGDEKLPGVHKLAKLVDSNIRTVGSAIRILINNGWLYSIPSKGTFITRIKKKRTNRIGFVLGGLNRGVSLGADLIAGSRRASDNHAQTIMIEFHNDDSALELQRVKHLVEEEHIDGIVIWPSSGDRIPPALAYLKERAFPTVLIPQVDISIFSNDHTVGDDHPLGFHHLVEGMIQRGYRDLRFVTNKMNLGKIYTENRYQQYCNTLKAHQLKPKPLIEIESPHPNAASLKDLIGCDAALCVNDDTAVALYGACVRAGLAIPRDLVITGYNNWKYTEELGITSVEQNFVNVGSIAIDLLIKDIEGQLQTAEHIHVQTDIKWRCEDKTLS